MLHWMIYDYIIAGGGIAGSICAYELSKKGANCLIVEKNETVKEKVCGGGVPRKAIDLLRHIGIDIDGLLHQDVSIIKGHTIMRAGFWDEHIYPNEAFSLGIRRCLLDSFLLEQAVSQGTQIRFGEKVSEVTYRNGLYTINGYQAGQFVCAVGARGLWNGVPKGQSIGISAQILGKCNLPDDRFYYLYHTNRDDRYLWMFPIGASLWNAGVWFRVQNRMIAQDYRESLLPWIESCFSQGYQVVSKPRGEFLGNVDQRNLYGNRFYGIGDFAGTNNIKNGGGILSAIKSAIALTGSVERMTDPEILPSAPM